MYRGVVLVDEERGQSDDLVEGGIGDMKSVSLEIK